MILRVLKPYRATGIYIISHNKKRQIDGLPSTQIHYKVFCGTRNVFDELPEVVRIKVGSNVNMRSDSVAWYNWDQIEMAGKVGKIKSIGKPQSPFGENSTLAVDVNGINKEYSPHRFIDASGNSMQIGWRYLLSREDNVLVATPTNRIDPEHFQ